MQGVTEVSLNKEELAWAAGFYDGEGCTSYRNKSKLIPTLNIGQADPYVLQRFKSAVGDLGSIYGPFYCKKYPNRKPQWNYQSGGFESTQVILSRIWNWLSPGKKTQAATVFKNYKDRLKNTPDTRMNIGVCKRGHNLTLKDAFIKSGSRQRRCRLCHIYMYELRKKS